VKSFRVGAVVLAAGRSTRMGPRHKLLLEIDGIAVVAHAVLHVLASKASPVVVVVGHGEVAVRAVLEGIPVELVSNPDYGDGLSSSIRVGVAALGDGVDGVLICLADMPRIHPADCDALIDDFASSDGACIVAPVHTGRRGHPVLWPRPLFQALMELEGDEGARRLFVNHADRLRKVTTANPGVLIDLDTPEDLAKISARGHALEE
jgi:molybdenum cofactor cytidylyltransferase